MFLDHDIVSLYHQINSVHTWVFNFIDSVHSWDKWSTCCYHKVFGYVWKHIKQSVFLFKCHCFYDVLLVFCEEEKASTHSSTTMWLIRVCLEYLHPIKLWPDWSHYVQFVYLINTSDVSKDSRCIACYPYIYIYVFCHHFLLDESFFCSMWILRIDTCIWFSKYYFVTSIYTFLMFL